MSRESENEERLTRNGERWDADGVLCLCQEHSCHLWVALNNPGVCVVLSYFTQEERRLREGGQYMGIGDSDDWGGGRTGYYSYQGSTSVSGLKSSTRCQLLKCPLSSQSRDGMQLLTHGLWVTFHIQQ